jgi:hypothetical protein
LQAQDWARFLFFGFSHTTMRQFSPMFVSDRLRFWHITLADLAATAIFFKLQAGVSSAPPPQPARAHAAPAPCRNGLFKITL